MTTTEFILIIFFLLRQFMCVASYDDTDDACDTDRGFEQKGGNCFVYVENKMNWNEVGC